MNFRAPQAFATDPARRMRIIAAGLLVAMAALFVLARSLEPRYPAWGFVRAFAEAAMVGGLADWFAVTALFRHPLGLPIPHTAIIPRNKDRIGDNLALFLRDNFLVPRVVARRMASLDAAEMIGRFLAAPASEGRDGGRIARGASRLAADLLGALDQDRLGGMAKAAIVTRLRALEVSPLAGQALTAAIADGRHVPVIDSMVMWAWRTLDANEHIVRDMIHERAGSVMRWTGLDETLANKILTGLHKLLLDMVEDRDHPLRRKAEEGLANLADDLQRDPDLRARVEALKSEVIGNPAVAAWIDGLWESGRGALLKVVQDPNAALAGRFGDMLKQLGETMRREPRLKRAINQFVRRAVVGAAASYGDTIVRLVSDTVRQWDAGTVTARIEAAVGRDLQYIRINGTLVGGLVGVAIHAVQLL
jgi:uncharacterized membrane-anchored protein YjiN (DUF445 family)